MPKATMEEVLGDIACKIKDDGSKVLNRFNRRNFDKLVHAAANDPEFTTQVAIIRNKAFQGYEEIAVGKDFRKWLRQVVEKAGIDPEESAVVEGGSFQVPKMDWLYDFFAEVLWLYLQDNKFDLPKKEEFEATLSLKSVDPIVTESESKKPGTKEVLGRFETKKGAHYTLAVKSKCPSYLVSRRRIDGK